VVASFAVLYLVIIAQIVDLAAPDRSLLVDERIQSALTAWIR
jgi:hypothetical protein